MPADVREMLFRLSRLQHVSLRDSVAGLAAFLFATVSLGCGPGTISDASDNETSETASATGAPSDTSTGSGVADSSTASEGSETGSASVSGSATGSQSETSSGSSASTTTGEEITLCEVNYLFVIDNSASMEQEYAAFRASLGDLLDVMRSTLGDGGGARFKIMVVDSDGPTCCDTDPPEGCEGSVAEACDQVPPPPVDDPCDGKLGAGIVSPRGRLASNEPCDLEHVAGNNPRYIDYHVNDELASFECIASVGLSGQSNERPLEAMTTALASAPYGQEDSNECNDGITDIAGELVVVTVITDGHDEHSAGTLESWSRAIGGGKRVAFLAIGGDTSDPACATMDSVEDAPELRALASEVEQGRFVSICQVDYADALRQALSLFQESDGCNGFVPPDD